MPDIRKKTRSALSECLSQRAHGRCPFGRCRTPQKGSVFTFEKKIVARCVKKSEIGKNRRKLLSASFLRTRTIIFRLKKNGHGAEKITPCPFFVICGCRNPACITRACDKCLRLLSGLRLQRAESGFSIGAIPRKQTHRRYNPLYAAVRKWSCRT